jgi:hypothetical protein
MRILDCMYAGHHRSIYARKLHRVRVELQEAKGNKPVNIPLIRVAFHQISAYRLCAKGVIYLLRLTCSYLPMSSLFGVCMLACWNNARSQEYSSPTNIGQAIVTQSHVSIGAPVQILDSRKWMGSCTSLTLTIWSSVKRSRRWYSWAKGAWCQFVTVAEEEQLDQRRPVRRVVYIAPYKVSTMLNGCQKIIWKQFICDLMQINIWLIFFADFLIICKKNWCQEVTPSIILRV